MSERLVRPVAPSEVVDLQREQIPSAVIATVNSMIAEQGGGYVILRQKDIQARLQEAGLDVAEIYEKGWLNFEDLYRQAGWEVEYDKPGYNETYDANFVFKPAKER
jgi:hypothetical protein